MFNVYGKLETVHVFLEPELWHAVYIFIYVDT